METTIYIVNSKQVITKLVNIFVFFAKEYLAYSTVADATSETLNAQGSCSEENKSLVNSKDLRKTTECQVVFKNTTLSVLQASSFMTR